MVKCIETPKDAAENIMRLLKRFNVIDRGYKVTRVDDKVLIPIRQGIDMGYLGGIITGYNFRIVNCNPPPTGKTPIHRLPSHDRIGNVVILRENVIIDKPPEEIDEIIESIRRVYKGVKAIYVKTKTTGIYRVPELKLLWGEPIREVIHKEYGLRFRVLLDKVYFNPRLGEEHHRLAEYVGDGERVFDVFAGIGGFSIHMVSRRRVVVVSNDLNPYCYRLIIENTLLNRKRIKGVVIATNLDASALPHYFGMGVFDRVIANLPAESHRFFNVYDYLLRAGGILHIYMLGHSCGEVIGRIKSGWRVIDCKRVLDYAPRLYIYRVDLVKG